MKAWPLSFRNRHQDKTNHRRRAPRLGCEYLEARQLLAIDIVINAGAGLQANQAAMDAFNDAAAAWEASISDPITVTINADLANLGNSNIIGQAGSVLLQDAYDVMRGYLVADAAGESDDGIVASLPTSAQASFFLPTGFGLSPYLVGSKASLKAAGYANLDGQFGEIDAEITFNTQFSFDYDSSDGVAAGTMDFKTVAAHEIGHALGFISTVDTVDYYSAQGTPVNISPFTLDLFRFENGGQYDPSNAAEFTSFPRTLVPGVDAVTDQITAKGSSAAENRMSTGAFTGDGRQASHWKDNDLTGTTIGVMDPTLSFQQVIGIGDADLRALDLIGYDIAFEDDGNSVPVAVDDTAKINKKSGVATGNVLENDTDSDGDGLTASIVGQPSNGTVSLNPANGSFTYTPDGSFSGTDSFTYVANDGTDDSNLATVAITAKGSGGGGGGGKPGGGGGGGGRGNPNNLESLIASFRATTLVSSGDSLEIYRLPSGLNMSFIDVMPSSTLEEASSPASELAETSVATLDSLPSLTNLTTDRLFADYDDGPKAIEGSLSTVAAALLQEDATFDRLSPEIESLIQHQSDQATSDQLDELIASLDDSTWELFSSGSWRDDA